MDEDVTVSVRADLTEFRRALGELAPLANDFGAQLTGALRSAVFSGRSLEQVLRQIGLNLAGMALNRALQPLQTLFSTFLTGIFGGSTAAAMPGGAALAPHAPASPPHRQGAATAQFGISPPFGFDRAMLDRIRSRSPQTAPPPAPRAASGIDGAVPTAQHHLSVVFNVSTPDAASFRKSEAQLTGMLARAVARGSRSI